jgi:hypothetical protein
MNLDSGKFETLSIGAISFDPTTGQILYEGGSGPVETETPTQRVYDIVGDDVASSFAIVHDFHNRWVTASVYNASGDNIAADVTITLTDADTVTVDFGIVVPTALDEYKVVISGVQTVV